MIIENYDRKRNIVTCLKLSVEFHPENFRDKFQITNKLFNHLIIFTKIHNRTKL